jgi:predicted Zn finger-like uncharacterized protein
MIITCPECASQYRIDPSRTTRRVARVKCPACSHLFEVEVPASSSEPAAPAVPAAADTKPVVLVVDDAPFFREMITDILKDLPVSLATAANGDEAWQLIQDAQPRLLLLDLNIPGKSGYDLLKAIQQRPAMSNMKILVMSGVQRGEQVSSEVTRLGADGFLNKSFTPRDLQERVRQILAI